MGGQAEAGSEPGARPAAASGAARGRSGAGARLKLGLRSLIPTAASFRSWAIDANDGIIATAGVLQGFGGAGASDRVLLLAAIASTLAGGLSIGGAKWAEEAAEREAQLRLAEEELRALSGDPTAEIAELAAHWEQKGLTAETARRVAEELSAHDALAAQLDAEYGIEEIMSRAAPVWSGVAAAIAFIVGAAVPLAITWFAPVAVEIWAILSAVVVALILTSIVAARAGHLILRNVLARSLTVGIGTMAAGYLAGLVLF